MKRRMLWVVVILFFAGVFLFGISSCGFVGALFDKGSGNNSGTNDYYTLTINYEYWGTAPVSSGHPIVLWIIPLDENGNYIEDTSNPDGGPVREVEEAYNSNGSVSVTLATGTYAILAFLDSVNKNGMPDIREPYVLYNDKYFAGSTVTPYTDSSGTTQYFIDPHWDTIDLSDHDENIYLGFGNEGQKYAWHNAYIAQPDDGEFIKLEPYTVVGGCFGGQNTNLQLEVDGNPVTGGVTVNDRGDTWYARINISDYPYTSSHSLRIKSLNDTGEQFDSYSIGFVENDGQDPTPVYITSPYENQYIHGRLDITGKYNSPISQIEVYIDGAYDNTIYLDGSNNTWQYSMDATSLANGFHYIEVDGYDASDMLVDIDTVDFIWADGAYAYVDPVYDGSSKLTTVDGYFDIDAVKTVYIQITDSGGLVWFEYDADSMDFTTGYWYTNVPVTSLSSGSYTLTAYARDIYGNVLSTSQITFTKP